MPERKPTLTEALQWPPGLHPCQQSHLWFPFPLYECQRTALEQAAMPRSRVATVWPNEAGKTSCLIPIFLLSAMVAFPGCFCCTTSGSEAQVKEQLFFRNLLPRIRPLIPNGWKISTSSMTVDAPNGSHLLGYKCVKGGKAEGFHGAWTKPKGKWRYEPMIYVVDEAKTVEREIYEAIMRIDPDFLLVVSTPGPEEGWLYDAIDPDDLMDVGEDDDEIEIISDMSREQLRSELAREKERLAGMKV